MNDIILVEVAFKILLLSNFQVRKHLFGFAALAVIGRQHICRNRLSKSSRTAVADIFFCGIHHAVDVLKKARLINIYF